MKSEYTILKAREHEKVELSDEHKKWLNEKLNNKKTEILGLHQTQKGIAPGNFVGAVWIGDGESKTPLIVRSKFEEMDYMSMYLACAEDPVVSPHINKCFNFWPDQQPIEAEDLPKLSELLIAAFLRELNELCARHLRRHFVRETDNLRGKVKGKILLPLQIKQNLVRGRLDRVFCSYQTVNHDIPENRVLRAALEQSAKFVNSRPDPKPLVLHRWIHSSRSALSGVPVVEVKRTDFRNLRVRGVFFHYRRAVKLAEFVLRRLGTNPRAEVKEDVSTPPFAINSAELFERYAEKILRDKKYPGLEAGYERSNIGGDSEGFNVTVRPDFRVPKNSDGTAIIIDAKYKSTENNYNPSREDIFQIVSYSRHKNFLKNKLNCDETDNIELALVYPVFDGGEKIRQEKTDNSFFAPITVFCLECPAIPEESANEEGGIKLPSGF